MNGNTTVIASISLLLLQHWASFSKLSWSDLSLVKWQLSALKDFLKRELGVLQGESVQFSFTPTHSLFLYFLLRFPGTDILYKYSCILMHPWHRWVVHSLSTTLLSSIALTIFLVLKLTCRTFCFENRPHTVRLSPKILWAPTNDEWQVQVWAEWQPCWPSKVTHADLGFVVSVKRAWVWLAGFGRELMWESVKLRGRSKDKQLSPIALWDTSATCPLVCSGFVCACVKAKARQQLRMTYWLTALKLFKLFSFSIQAVFWQDLIRLISAWSSMSSVWHTAGPDRWTTCSSGRARLFFKNRIS